MPITLTDASRAYGVPAILELLRVEPLVFDRVRPQNEARLTEQILTRWDFTNARFSSMAALRQRLIAAVLEEAVDVLVDDTSLGLTRTEWTKAPFPSQFKAMHIAKIGEMQFLRMEGNNLDKEAALLQQISNMGLRTVPVYEATSRRMFQQCIRGVFLDLYKEDLTRVPEGCGMPVFFLGLLSALFRCEGMPSGEAGFLRLPTFEKDLRRATEGRPLPVAGMLTALADFTKLQNLMRTGIRQENDRGEITYEPMFIADLQGVLEFGTGKFYVIDPLAVVPVCQAKPLERRLIDQCEKNLNGIVNFLRGALFPDKQKVKGGGPKPPSHSKK